ncbi:MAG TPA: HlyD family secretion protein [Candidatus Angelobacter sp.]|nr:HlyD family secretion protein [Candidatus Angelobacter sp.]
MATQLQPPPKPELFEVEETAATHAQSAPAPRRSLAAFVRQNRKIVFLVAVLVLVAAGVWGWFYLSSYETTDDAQVEGHLHPVSARISGTILRVNPAIEDSHYVEAGTVIAEIDPADFQADRDRAQAEYERLRASSLAAEKDIVVTSSQSHGRLDLATAAVTEAEDSVASEKAALDAAQARLAQARDKFKWAEGDRQRFEHLLAKHEISQSEYDRASTEASTDREAITAAQADVVAAQKHISQAQSRLVQRKADLLAANAAPQQIASTRAKAEAAVSDASRAKAQLATVDLNLGYTKIIAPVSGLIGRKTVESGQRVQPGQQLLTIVPIDDLWITANFKENQLRKIKPGQPATLHSDSTGLDYRGHIDALGAATGSRFSLLPPENASGNYVKVVQRVPVRILLESGENADHRLRPGMSIEATAHLR